jgi:hypothetical protein
MEQEAKRIAQAIADNVETALNGQGTIEELSQSSKALWDEARAKGLQVLVGQILQEDSLKEMAQAMRLQGLQE